MTPQTPKPLHIFKPGQFVAMNGVSHEFTPARLKAIAAAYNPSIHEAPITVGHPQHDLPAHGWVQGLQFHEGDDETPAGLYALPAQVNPGFADMVAAGAFKKISAAFYSPDSPNNPVPGEYYIRHVGFLGAQPPAVKGLRNPAFGDAEEGVVEFGDAMHLTPSSPQESTVTEEEAARLRAENEQLKADKAAAAQAARHAENTAFAEGLVASGQLLSGAVPTIVATLNHLAGADTPVEFGEGDAKVPLLDALKVQLKAVPKLVEFSEQATTQRVAGAGGDAEVDDPAFADADPERLALHKKVLAYAKDKKVPYAEAAAAVIK